MRIFIDTEFYENGETIKLISIGAVREDGETYYAETKGARELCFRSEWLVKNVLPCLALTDNVRRERTEIARELLAFAGDQPEFWAYYADYDWVTVCQLYGRMIDLPSGWPMYCRDFKQWLDENGKPRLNEMPYGAEHNALADASWLASEFKRLRPVIESAEVGA